MTIKAGIGLSTEKDPAQAAREAIRLAKSNIGKDKIDLAVIFSSTDFASHTLLKTIAAYLEGVPLIGCSGAAIISSQGIFQHGLALMLLSLPKDVYINTACIKDVKTKPPLSVGEELGEKLLYGFKDIRRDLGILFSDGIMPEGQTIISGLQERLGRSFPLVGASTSDSLRFLKTNLYFNQDTINDAICGIIWGGKLNFGLGIKHGWKPLGKPRKVTRSQGNILYEIDGSAATNVYEEYLDCELSTLRKELKYISIFYPVGIHIPGEEEYLLRNILSIEDDGSLVLRGNVPEGSTIRLMIGTKESCLNSTRQALEETKKGLSGHNSNLVFVFDSISRYILLGREAHRELEIIQEALGKDTPLIGLYTYGEQAPLRAINYLGQVYFQNQSIAILSIGS